MSWMARIQVLTDDAEREAFRAQAKREGRSLSDWLREAGLERLRRSAPAALDDADALDAFFDEIDQRHARDAEGAEEDWSTTKARIAAGRTAGLPDDA